MKSLLLAYRQQLTEAAEFMQAKGETVSPGIVQAMKIIAEAMGITDWHWVSNDSPEPDEGELPSERPRI